MTERVFTVCNRCWKAKTHDHYARCGDCRNAASVYHRERRRKLVDDGKCYCGADPVEGKVTCQKCLDDRAARHKKPRKGKAPTKKRCPVCGPLPVEAFAPRGVDDRQTYCRPCTKTREEALHARRREIKAACGGCVDCHETNPDLLRGNGKLFSHARSLDAIDKAAVGATWLCHWCFEVRKSTKKPASKMHRTWFNAPCLDALKNLVYRKKRLIWDAKVRAGGCATCDRRVDRTDYARSRGWHWDHIDPATKVCDLAFAARWAEMTEERVAAELAKCQLLCANCHFLRTVAQRRANGESGEPIAEAE